MNNNRMWLKGHLNNLIDASSTVPAVFALLALGCSAEATVQDAGTPSDPSIEGPDVGGEGGGASVLAPCTERVRGELTALPGCARLAVVGSDYISTNLVVLGGLGEVVSDNWIDSGTEPAGVSALLSGDVVLASKQPQGSVVMIDRGNEVLTHLRRDGKVVGQLRVGVQAAAADANPVLNPQDAVLVDGERAWVSRREANADANAAQEDRGSDLIRVDLGSMTRLADRVDLSTFAGEVEVVVNGEVKRVAVQASPARMAVSGEWLVVGLDRVDFATPTFLPGAVALVHRDTLETRSHLLSDLANCGGVEAVPDQDDAVIVACAGWSTVGFGQPDERNTAGIVRLRVHDDGSVEELARWRPAEAEGTPLPVWSPVALRDGSVVAVDQLNAGGGAAYWVDLERSGAATPLVQEESVLLGRGIEEVNGTVFLPAAAVQPGGGGRVLRYRRTEGLWTAIEPVESPAFGPSPPRSIWALTE